MKIAMIGSGAAGSVFAAYLRKGGAELWLVDKYKAHMDKIAADGLVFRTPEGEEVLTGSHTSATAHDIGTMDMVILMVKATQTADVMADTMPCIGPETVVVSLQNGLGNDEVLAQFVETDRILYGSGLIGTELAGPGVCVSKPEKGIQMHFGAVHNNPKADAAGKALEACFQAGGCNASFDEDVRPYIWKKVIANSGYNGVSAVMRLKVKETFADPYGHDIVMHVWKEGCAVAQALGIGDLWPLMEKEEPNIVANLGNYYPSMAQDAVLHQRQTEISVLNGAIARYGERLGVPTPFNTVITKVISCIQNNFLTPDTIVFIHYFQLVYNLLFQEASISRSDDFHLTHHLADDYFEVFIVNLHTLQTIYVLDFIYDILLNSRRPHDSQNIRRSCCTIRQRHTSTDIVIFLNKQLLGQRHHIFLNFTQFRSDGNFTVTTFDLTKANLTIDF